MIVVDASVVAPALADDGDDGDRARQRLSGGRLVAPELLDLEVTSVVRKAVRGGDLDGRRAGLALADLGTLPVRRVGHRALLPRVWELHASVTPYDAVYVALAELLDVPLVTADGRLVRSPGTRCRFEQIG